MSDTPETDIECFIYEGDYVPASFARQLERERDEARKDRNAALSDRDAWARLCGAVDCYTPSTSEPYEALKIQRDALRAEIERLKADKARLDWLESNSHEWDILLNGKTVANSLIREAIDSAMKGAE